MFQSFTREAGEVCRSLKVAGRVSTTSIDDRADEGLSAVAAWWQSQLRGARCEGSAIGPPLKVVDAFCGTGGFGLGLQLAAEAIGVPLEFAVAVDTDEGALEVHRNNLKTRRCLSDSVTSLVDYHVEGNGVESSFAYDPEPIGPMEEHSGSVDLLIAGPPCQGHSNLNNHTRRQDPRNDLYVTTVALGVAVGARVILVENVPTVQNAQSNVVNTSAALLKKAGYSLSTAILRADELGACQRRARFFLMATRDGPTDDQLLHRVAQAHASAPMPLSWAIGDLFGRPADGLFDTPPALTSTNQARIDYLFDNDLFDLPNDQRPDCHRAGTSYTAVYGRMLWDSPTHTITTGFGTPGQGRYIHPRARRVITPREAARIQGYPDWFCFTPDGVTVRRKDLTKWIGDAVHPMMGYTAGMGAIESLLNSSLPFQRLAS